jgi:hypothetical protein
MFNSYGCLGIHMIKVSSSYALLEGTEQTWDGRLQHQTTHLSLHRRADRLQLCVFMVHTDYLRGNIANWIFFCSQFDPWQQRSSVAFSRRLSHIITNFLLLGPFFYLLRFFFSFFPIRSQLIHSKTHDNWHCQIELIIHRIQTLLR